jgi:hypothetical protein
MLICNSDNNIEHKIWANSSLFISNKFEFLWNSQVEVRESEGGTIDIHVSCTHKSDILFSTMKALDSLGLDVHQAVINCFNGFSIDVFKAKVYIYFSLTLLYIVFSHTYILLFYDDKPCYLFYTCHQLFFQN